MSRASELLALTAIVFWGNWAIFYWVMVVGLNATYASLKLWLPLLVVQIGLSLFAVVRLRLDSAVEDNKPPPAARGVIALRSRGYLVAALAAALFAVVFVAWYSGMWRPLEYSVTWAVLTPAAVFLYLGDSPASALGRSRERTGVCHFGVADGLGLLLAVAILCQMYAYRPGFSIDDSFYANVIATTLSHPDLPVQGKDLLLGTSAPYSVHPAYRLSGFEVLAALLGDLCATDPMWIYWEVFPALGYAFWLLATHFFFRAIGLQYPGVAVVLAVLLVVNWHAPRSLGRFVLNMATGKAHLSAVGAPLLFGATALFVRRPGRASWFVFMLAICGAAAWSTSGLFVVPLTVLWALAVFVPLRRGVVFELAMTALALVPLILVTAVAAHTAAEFPPSHLSDVGGGLLFLAESSLGGRWAPVLLLLALLALPVVAARAGPDELRSTLLRFALVGAFGVYAPYWIEILARLSGLSFVAWRAQWTFPSLLVPGMLGALLLQCAAHAWRSSDTTRLRWVGLALALVGLWGVLFVGTLAGTATMGNWFDRIQNGRAWKRTWLAEAAAARALIPADAYVEPGYLDALLPILPNPPKFVWVRHYLPLHRGFISAEEFFQRASIHRASGMRTFGVWGPVVESDPAAVVAMAEKLGVTTFVFRANPKPLARSHREVQSDVAALERALRDRDYRCETTPSGGTRVCNVRGIESGLR